MPDTVRTLSALQTLLADNTAGDISPQDVRDMLVSTYQLDHSADIAITGAATATIGRWHLCTGTSADYTVTLPAASGNAGKLIGLRMSSALTKLVTIDANSTELIDGSQTQVMWANEVAVLFCDGTGWTKIAGKTIALAAQMSRAAAQSINRISIVKIAFDTVEFDASGLFADNTNNRFDIPRPANYVASCSWFGSTTNTAQNQSRIHAGPSGSLTERKTGLGGLMPFISEVIPMTAADFIEMHVYHENAAASINTQTDAGTRPRMSVLEVPAW